LTTKSNSSGTYLKSWNTPGSKHHAVEEADGDEELLIVRQAHPPLPQLLPSSASIFSKYHLLVKFFFFHFLQVLPQTGACSSTSLSKIMHKGPKNPEHQFSIESTDLTMTMEKEAIIVTIAANLEPKAQFSKATRTVQAVRANQL
jgi:hypothetical protein